MKAKLKPATSEENLKYNEGIRIAAEAFKPLLRGVIKGLTGFSPYVPAAAREAWQGNVKASEKLADQLEQAFPTPDELSD